MVDLSKEKARLRKIAYAQRKEAHAKGSGATEHLVRAIADQGSGTLAGYWPIRTEINPIAAMESLSSDRRIVLPVVDGAGLPLSFRYWVPGAQMIEGAFGAAIPADKAGEDPVILIVPMVAFDARGYRLGYGGGFYDRTLAKLKEKGPAIAVGLAYSGQELPHVPVEPTDQPLDYLVTEKGIRKFG